VWAHCAQIVVVSGLSCLGNRCARGPPVDARGTVVTAVWRTVKKVRFGRVLPSVPIQNARAGLAVRNPTSGLVAEEGSGGR